MKCAAGWSFQINFIDRVSDTIALSALTHDYRRCWKVTFIRFARNEPKRAQATAPQRRGSPFPSLTRPPGKVTHVPLVACLIEIFPGQYAVDAGKGFGPGNTNCIHGMRTGEINTTH